MADAGGDEQQPPPADALARRARGPRRRPRPSSSLDATEWRSSVDLVVGHGVLGPRSRSPTPMPPQMTASSTPFELRLAAPPVDDGERDRRHGAERRRSDGGAATRARGHARRGVRSRLIGSPPSIVGPVRACRSRRRRRAARRCPSVQRHEPLGHRTDAADGQRRPGSSGSRRYSDVARRRRRARAGRSRRRRTPASGPGPDRIAGATCSGVACVEVRRRLAVAERAAARRTRCGRPRSWPGTARRRRPGRRRRRRRRAARGPSPSEPTYATSAAISRVVVRRAACARPGRALSASGIRPVDSW